MQPPARSLWVVGVALLFASGCGTAIRNDGAPITNPLNDRSPTARPTSRPPEQGSLLAEPEPAGPGGATDAEGAAVRALELVAEVLAVPPRELRAESVVARPGVGGWRVTVRDVYRNPHTVDVAEAATTWLGETRDEGVLVARDETQRIVVVQAQGRPLTLRLPAAGSARSVGIAPGTPVVFGYDASPRGDGTLILAWLETRP